MFAGQFLFVIGLFLIVVLLSRLWLAAGPRLGANATFNYNTSSYGSPTWQPIGLARDVTLGHGYGKGDVSHKSAAVKQQEPTLAELNIAIEVLEVPSDTVGFVYLRNAYFNKTVLDTAVCTAAMTPASGELYTRCDYKVFSMEQSQPLEGVDVWKFTLEPCYSTNPLVNGTA